MSIPPYPLYSQKYIREYLKNKYCTKIGFTKVLFGNFVKSQVRSLPMSALNEVFSSLVPLHRQESESVLTVISTK